MSACKQKQTPAGQHSAIYVRDTIDEARSEPIPSTQRSTRQRMWLQQGGRMQAFGRRTRPCGVGTCALHMHVTSLGRMKYLIVPLWRNVDTSEPPNARPLRALPYCQASRPCSRCGAAGVLEPTTPRLYSVAWQRNESHMRIIELTESGYASNNLR